MKYTKEIYNHISLYLDEIDLTNFGISSKKLLFLLEKYKIKIVLNIDLIPIILLYNTNNQLIGSTTNNTFSLIDYLNKYYSIQKIVFEFGLSSFNFNDTEETRIKFYEDDKINFSYSRRKKQIFFFDRNQLINNKCNLFSAKTIKFNNIGISSISMECINNEFFKCIYPPLHLIKDDNICQMLVKHNSEFPCPENFYSSNFIKKDTDIHMKLNIGILKKKNFLIKLTQKNKIKSLHLQNKKIASIPIDNLEKLYLENTAFENNFIFPYKLKSLGIESSVKIPSEIYNKICELKYLSELTLSYYSPLLSSIGNKLTHLAILNITNAKLFNIKFFRNLEYLKIPIPLNKTLDLSNIYNIRHVYCIMYSLHQIYFNKNIRYENVNLFFQENVDKLKLTVDKIVLCSRYFNCDTMLDLSECEINKLILRNRIKVVNFPKGLTQINLYRMVSYSFSDFPDSVEKIFIEEYRYGLNKQGKFPKNLKELTIKKICKNIYGKKLYKFEILKVQHLRKFITSIHTLDSYFPIGNIETTYIDKRGHRCIIYR